MAGSGGVGLLSAAVAPYPAAMDIDFSEDEIRRYSRHILLREVGGTGQAKLKAARVLVVGAGGLARRWCCIWPQPGSARSASSMMTWWNCRPATADRPHRGEHRHAEDRIRRRRCARDQSRRHDRSACHAADRGQCDGPGVALRPGLRRHRQFCLPLPGGRCLRAGAPHTGLRRGAAVRRAVVGVSPAYRRAVLPLPVSRAAAARPGAELQEAGVLARSRA